mgnify:CR=1 FL=1
MKADRVVRAASSDQPLGREEIALRLGQRPQIPRRAAVARQIGRFDDQQVEVAVGPYLSTRTGSEQDDPLRIAHGADAPHDFVQQPGINGRVVNRRRHGADYRNKRHR